MSRVLLTGATGFIGGHVARSLLLRGYEVQALVRPGSLLDVRHDSLRTIEGDVRDRASIVAALRDCDTVIHTAGVYSFWQKDPGLIFDVNVAGTRNVLEAAVAAGTGRVVFTSSVGNTAFRRDGSATEADIAGPAAMAGDYKRSKWEAERVARRMASGGAPIVIVCPTAPVGPGDAKPTPTGSLIIDFLKGKLPAFVDTGLNFVDVADVADGHVLALERGVDGERYLLGNVEGNLTLRELLERLSALTGRPAPRLQIPHGVAIAAAYADRVLEGGVLRREPHIPLEGARMARTRMWVDPSKAVRELGMPQSSIDDALRRAIDWFGERAYATRPTTAHGKPGA